MTDVEDDKNEVRRGRGKRRDAGFSVDFKLPVGEGINMIDGCFASWKRPHELDGSYWCADIVGLKEGKL